MKLHCGVSQLWTATHRNSGAANGKEGEGDGE
jgi:hypothetical protein